MSVEKDKQTILDCVSISVSASNIRYSIDIVATDWIFAELHSQE